MNDLPGSLRTGPSGKGWFFLATLATTTVILAWATSTLVQQGQEIAALRDEVAKQNDAISRVAVQMGQQDALFSRALGVLKPIPMPLRWLEAIGALEQQTVDKKNWPGSGEEANAYRVSVGSLVAEAPPWLEGEPLERLNRVRWSALAFRVISAPIDVSIPLLTEQLDESRALVAAVPEGIGADLYESLEAYVSKLEATIGGRRYESALRGAMAFIEGSTTDADVQELYAELEPHRETFYVAWLLDKLRVRILGDEARRFVELKRRSLIAARALAERQPILFHQSLAALSSEVAAARTSLALQGASVAEVDKLDTEISEELGSSRANLARNERTRQGEALRLYQDWALNEIETASRGIDEARKVAKDAAMVAGEKWGPLEYKKVHDSLVDRLLPIDTRLLEIPLNEQYSETFRAGWEILKNAPKEYGGLQVARRSISIEKQPLDPYFKEKE